MDIIPRFTNDKRGHITITESQMFFVIGKKDSSLEEFEMCFSKH